MNRNGFPESDWTVWRALYQKALERYCERVLKDLAKLEKGEGSAHERYLQIWELLKERDRLLSKLFDNPRRSTALMAITLVKREGLITDEEFALFSKATQAHVTRVLNLVG